MTCEFCDRTEDVFIPYHLEVDDPYDHGILTPKSYL